MVAGSTPGARFRGVGRGGNPRPQCGVAWLEGAAAARVAAATALLVAAAAPAVAGPQAEISGLSDLAFGTVTSLASDAVRTESICVFSNTKTNGYSVTASGTGTGGAFTLASGAFRLGYDVEWSDLSGQTTGTLLSPNTALTGLTSSATVATCNKGPATSASLIVVLRAASLSSARAGSYSGTLTLLITPQ
jgi:hypothetical protein